jgi:hypothetical protein
LATKDIAPKRHRTSKGGSMSQPPLATPPLSTVGPLGVDIPTRRCDTAGMRATSSGYNLGEVSG